MPRPFERDRFVEQCRAAARASDPVGAIRALVREAVRSLAAGEREIAPVEERFAQYAGEICLGCDEVLYEGDDVSVFLIDTLPGNVQPAHDHRMCAVIGVFEGAEVNRFFRRDGATARLATRRTVRPGEAIALRERTVHAIGAADGVPSRAIHVYLGRLDGQPRSLFDPDTGAESVYEFDRYLALTRAA